METIAKVRVCWCTHDVMRHTMYDVMADGEYVEWIVCGDCTKEPALQYIANHRPRWE